MAEIVFILGAGASVHAGVPVMKDFFDEAYDLYDDGKITGEDKEFFKRVIEAKNSIRSILANLQIDINNIETIFSLIEMGKLIRRFPGFKDEDIDVLHKAIYRFIVRTIELKTNFIYKKREGLFSPQEYYYFVQRFILPLEEKKRLSSCILTFNYDIALDHALELWFGEHNINYCLSNIEDNKYRLLKLHGSINWAKYKKNNHIDVIPVSIRDYVVKGGLIMKLDINSDFPGEASPKKDVHIEIGTKINKLKWMNNKWRSIGNIEDIPLIVPPTWNKTEYHLFLSNVWKQAAKEISEAKYIFIIGYSLPETDLFFQYLLGLGMLDIVRLKGFWVFDPKSEVRDRYGKMLSSAIKDKFIPYPNEFSSSGALASILGVLKDKLSVNKGKTEKTKMITTHDI